MRYADVQVIEENRSDGGFGLGHQQYYKSNHVDIEHNKIYPPDKPEYSVDIRTAINGRPVGNQYSGLILLKRYSQERIY